MPYFVYAVHTDSTKNRLYDKPFDNSQEAYILEREMEEGRASNDNYFVRTVFAESEAEAERMIENIRRDNGLPCRS